MKTRWDVILEAKKLLNGREMGSEVSNAEEEWLKSADLIVCFGASDDLVEIRGAVHDEISLYDGGEFHFINGGLYERACESDECPHEESLAEGTYDIKALWDKNGVSWSYETDIPHETFEVMEDGEVFCRGIIFARESVSGYKP